jgi:hypothetical protein
VASELAAGSVNSRRPSLVMVEKEEPGRDEDQVS